MISFLAGPLCNGGSMAYGLTAGFVMLFCSIASPAEKSWPGAQPDCWSESRFFHNQEMLDIWKDRTVIRQVREGKAQPGTYSPNKGYYFTVEGGRPNGSVTVYAEKAYLLRIEFSELFGLAEVRWVNEKLLFMRPWWGRILGTDLIYDVETEKIIYAETVTDGYLAFQQFRESCPALGCECIKKK
jgi:hypothetical protein